MSHCKYSTAMTFVGIVSWSDSIGENNGAAQIWKGGDYSSVGYTRLSLRFPTPGVKMFQEVFQQLHCRAACFSSSGGFGDLFALIFFPPSCCQWLQELKGSDLCFGFLFVWFGKFGDLDVFRFASACWSAKRVKPTQTLNFGQNIP